MARPRKKRILARSSGLSWPKLEEVGSSTAMAFIGKLGEQTYTVEIEEVEKSLYRVAVDGNEFLVDGRKTAARSEEHTSELQSRGHLVCRLLRRPRSPLFPYTTLFRSGSLRAVPGYPGRSWKR